MAESMARRRITTEISGVAPRHRGALALLVVGVAGWAGWLVWRLMTLGGHPLQVVVLLIELSGWTAALLVARGLLGSNGPRQVRRREVDTSYRYAHAVADRVGRTRSSDLQHDVRAAADRLMTRRAGTVADRTMIGVLIEGPRRFVLVTALAVGLLLGVAPMEVPPLWALIAVIAGTACVSVGHVVGSDGSIRLGDRTRWSFASLGELFSASDRDDLAPRRWVGTVATIVVLNLAIALRGMSDRWTHGLPPMSDAERVVSMSWASLVVLGGLYALRTIPTPKLGNAHLVARRLEERTARQSALGAAVCVGVIGLLAGVLPGNIDTADHDPVRVEPVPQLEADGRNGG